MDTTTNCMVPSVSGWKDHTYTIDLDSLYKEFYQNGYIVVRNCLPEAIVLEWSRVFTHPSFVQSILEIMSENHHIVQPSFTINVTDTGNHSHSTKVNDASVVSNESNLDTTAAVHQPYTIQCGMKNGYREIVMRSPGRYEIALLSLFDISTTTTSTHHETTSPMKKRLPVLHNHPVPQTLINSMMETIQSSLSFVPNLLNQQPPSFHNHTKDDTTKRNDDTTGTTAPQTSPPLQQRYTWSDVKIINISLIISTPGSTDQKWHADGGHVDIERHLPCHCSNIFIPLTPITQMNGPTEFRPRSHFYTRQLTKLMLLAKVRKELPPIDAPLVSSLGDIIIFDYRILHRGRGNCMSPTDPCAISTTSDPHDDDKQSPTCRENNLHGDHVRHHKNSKSRVLLVVTVALPWFRDVLNYPKSRSIYDARHDV